MVAATLDKARTDLAFANLCMIVWTEMADDLMQPHFQTMIILPDITYAGRLRDEIVSMLRAKEVAVYEATTWQVSGRDHQFIIRSVTANAFKGRTLNNVYMPMGTSIPDSKHLELVDMWVAMQPMVAATGVKVVEY